MINKNKAIPPVDALELKEILDFEDEKRIIKIWEAIEVEPITAFNGFKLGYQIGKNDKLHKQGL